MSAPIIELENQCFDFDTGSYLEGEVASSVIYAGTASVLRLTPSTGNRTPIRYFNWITPQRDPRIDAVTILMTRVRAFRGLEPGWDGEDGEPINPAAVEAVVKLLRHIGATQVQLPRIGPVQDGSIDLSWDLDDRFLLINVTGLPDEPPSLYGRTRHPGLKLEGPVESSRDLDTALRWIGS